MLRQASLIKNFLKPQYFNSIPRICFSSRYFSTKDDGHLTPMDGCTAAAWVAYHMSEACAIYPITPSSPMGESVDEFHSRGLKNIFGDLCTIKMMQSEAGAAGALHGAALAGSLTSTFTASQGLLLMLPNMLKIAGELLPTVFHVAARHVSMQGLSIYGDFSDVMACRNTGFAMLSSASVQECMDNALVAHLATIKSRVPFMHFFDGFRLSHEISSIKTIEPDDMKALVDYEALAQYRQRALLPEHPYCVGIGTGPDVTFQTVEAANQYHNAVPDIVQYCMDQVSGLTGRPLLPFEYKGAPDAERVIVVMGAAGAVAEEAAQHLNATGEKVGVLKIRLYRPWAPERFLEVLPQSVKSVAVLDRTKEHGSFGEPMYLDVAATCQERNLGVKVLGGRYGLASKDFTPSHAVAVFDNMKKETPKNHFTVGIKDDLTNLSIPIERKVHTLPKSVKQAMFFGMSSDGTVGANKAAVKMAVSKKQLHGQAYFAYSADKANALTRSYLRFSDNPITSHYLIEEAGYVGVHKTNFLARYPVLKQLAPSGTFVINAPWDSQEEIEKHLPGSIKRGLHEKKAKFYVINASKIANECGVRGKISQVMQTAFLKLSGLLGSQEEFQPILEANIRKEFKKLGDKVINNNIHAVNVAADSLVEMDVPDHWAEAPLEKSWLSLQAPAHMQEVIGPVMTTHGNDMSVKTMHDISLGGVMPLEASKWEKKQPSDFISYYNPKDCIQCNACAFQCPHSCLRPILMTEEEMQPLADIATFQTLKARTRGLEKESQDYMKDNKFRFRITVSPLDCTGCGSCAAICPTNSLEIRPFAEDGENMVKMWDHTETLPDRSEHFRPSKGSVQGSQFNKPLLEFPGSCAGCTETAMMKTITQVCGERMVMANSSGCSSVWGGAYPRMPYALSDRGRGVAWGRSLFEDTAEYGYGMAVGFAHRRVGLYNRVTDVLTHHENELPADVAGALRHWQTVWRDGDSTLELYDHIRSSLSSCNSPALDCIKKPGDEDLWVKKSHWIVGGDGWAYDIGFGGLDHVVSSGHDLNIFIMDNEVYANTGAQLSKSTPRGATAKMIVEGKEVPKKDLGSMLMTYGNVYIASVATGTPKQMAMAHQAIQEADSFPGPSVVIAYCNCVQHYIKGGLNWVKESEMAVKSGYWPLFKYDPRRIEVGENALVIQSKPDFNYLNTFLETQARFTGLRIMFPDKPNMWGQLRADLERRWDTLRSFEQKFAVKEAPKAE
eukprot:GCRY01000732.1.p1 GENE.GCRY01000732.1~~GCRY01000732.1.p1  ORF type:complete len:1234 (+),score=388.28 GCRY01000732.1:198-3899(+)